MRKQGALAGFASASGMLLGTLSLLSVLLLSPTVALAYSDSNGLDRFSLSPTADGLVGMRSGKLLPHLRSESTFYMGYADRLLMGRGADGAEAVFVGNRVAGAVSTSLGLWGIGELDLVLPFVAHQQAWGNFRPLMDPTVRMDELASSGLSDLKLIPRAQLLDAARHHIDLALSLDISLPTGGAHGFLGDNRVLWRPSLAASMNLLSDLRVAVETGVLIRKSEHLLGDVDAATEFDLGVGAGWRFGPENRPFELQGSLGGVFGMSDAGKQQHSEFRSALSWEPLSGLQLLLGAGVGLIHSYGTPAWRAFSGIRYAFTIPTPARPEPLPEPVPEALPEPEPEEEPEEEPVVVEEDEPLPPPDELWLTVHFSDGSDQVDEEGRKILRRVAAVLRDRPELTLFVDGHSDARGVLELNLGLSLRRARAVVRLLQLEGVDGKRLKARGHGPKRPVADNDTEEGRRQNRRVEFLLQPTTEISESASSSGDTSQSESGADAHAQSNASAEDGGEARKASASKSESDAASAESEQRNADQRKGEQSQAEPSPSASSVSDSGESDSKKSDSSDSEPSPSASGQPESTGDGKPAEAEPKGLREKGDE